MRKANSGARVKFKGCWVTTTGIKGSHSTNKRLRPRAEHGHPTSETRRGGEGQVPKWRDNSEARTVISSVGSYRRLDQKGGKIIRACLFGRKKGTLRSTENGENYDKEHQYVNTIPKKKRGKELHQQSRPGICRARGVSHAVVSRLADGGIFRLGPKVPVHGTGREVPDVSPKQRDV